MKFDYRSVVASYIGVPIYFFLYIGHKVVRKSKRVIPNEADLWTGKQEPLHESAEVRQE
jgi:amino acid transporter